MIQWQTKAIKILKNPKIHEKMMHNSYQFIKDNLETEKIYAIFKKGLTTIYPELRPWFVQCDSQKNIPVHGAHLTQDKPISMLANNDFLLP